METLPMAKNVVHDVTGLIAEQAAAARGKEHEIFVSYRPSGRRYVRASRLYVMAMLWVGVVLALVWARSQQSPGDGVWHDGNMETMSGTLALKPYPMLLVDNPGSSEQSTFLLVETGKRACRPIDAEWNGKTVELQGWVLQRQGRKMFELAPEMTPKLLGESRNLQAHEDLDSGQQKAVVFAEVVDSKCYLGAMKPGSGLTHRACAALCLRGGIPPVAVAWGKGGQAKVFLLMSADGGPIGTEIAHLAGLDVVLQGHVGQIGDLPTLRVVPQEIQKLIEHAVRNEP
jgi:hypothetical protein